MSVSRDHETSELECRSSSDDPARDRSRSGETRADKPYGKLDRYPVGTVAVLGSRAAAGLPGSPDSRLGNDFVARSSTEELWLSLGRVWDAVYRHGQLDRVAVPLIGSGLSRLHGLDEESLLRLILLSFITHSRERVICRELRVVLAPSWSGWTSRRWRRSSGCWRRPARAVPRRAPCLACPWPALSPGPARPPGTRRPPGRVPR
ncbi:hypothetical protein STENM327S_09259 [Streptomyces tendae]